MQAVEILCALDERHVRCLGRHQQMILAGLYLGMRVDEMASGFGCSLPTIRRTITATVADVFNLTEIQGSPQLLRLWSERHWPCCTAAAREMIEDNQLLINW